MSVAPKLKARRIGPDHDGRRMSLADFAEARAAPGHLYELERGIVAVTQIPDVQHELIVQEIRDALSAHKRERSGDIHLVSGGAGSVLRMWKLQSERHPDVTVYLTPPPSTRPQAWNDWTPDLVVEVVSKSSRKRDYETKPGEYLAAGVREYWIIDPQERSARIHVRRGDTWSISDLSSRGTLRTSLLRGFALRLKSVFSVLK